MDRATSALPVQDRTASIKMDRPKTTDLQRFLRVGRPEARNSVDEEKGDLRNLVSLSPPLLPSPPSPSLFPFHGSTLHTPQVYSIILRVAPVPMRNPLGPRTLVRDGAGPE